MGLWSTTDEMFYRLGTGILLIAWMAAYYDIIRLGFRDRTYGMPLVAFCGNIAWEFHFSFVAPYEPVQQTADIVWFFMDLLILATIVRFGPAQFPTVPRWMFFAVLASTMAFSYVAVFMASDALGDSALMYTGFADTLMMSALFVAMGLTRGSLAGQSLRVGYLKWLGTPFGCAAFYFFDARHSHVALIALGAVGIFCCDGLYVAVLHQNRRRSAARQDAAPATPARLQAAG